jgi:Domain of unknown function (DUF4062)
MNPPLPTTKPRAFVSSVIDGFAEFRAAARRGIERAGLEPILAENFPSLSSSPRNACLDGVASSDVLVAVVGPRGGWIAPSGRLVVEEEIAHARGKSIPVLAFIQDETERDATAARLVKSLSDYVAGAFRRTFRSPKELETLVELSVRSLELPGRTSMVPDLTPTLRSAYRPPSSPRLRLALAPERREELISPVDLRGADLIEQIYGIGLDRKVRLFRHARSRSSRLDGERLVIVEDENVHGGDPAVQIVVAESGDLLFDLDLQRVENEPQGIDSAFVVRVASIEAAITSSFSFAGNLYAQLDQYERHQRFFYNACLAGLGYRTLERAPGPKGVHFMNAYRSENEVLVAHRESRLVARTTFADHQAEVARTVVRLEQRSQGK